MADNNDLPAYPLMFSSDQWSNKFSPFQGKPIPFPAQYQGVPTDAHGNPIQSYVDAQTAAAAAPRQASPVTLNSTPGDSGQWAVNNAIINGMQPTLRGAPDAGGRGAYTGYDISAKMAAMAANNAAYGTPTYSSQPIPGQPGYTHLVPSVSGGTGGGGGGANAGGGGGSPVNMSQAYLNALANPGHVSTPGATVAQSAPPSAQSGVLQQFLQNWQNRGQPTQGAGNYNNAGFFNALKGTV
jgi:hypothetical protein